jgi:hypothetical protein
MIESPRLDQSTPPSIGDESGEMRQEGCKALLEAKENLGGRF